MELITKENPMTPERMRKIQAFRLSGYTVLVWYEEDLTTFEKYEEKMTELQKLLGRYDEQEMKLVILGNRPLDNHLLRDKIMIK